VQYKSEVIQLSYSAFKTLRLRGCLLRPALLGMAKFAKECVDASPIAQIHER
jgi:hypothetical protein